MGSLCFRSGPVFLSFLQSSPKPRLDQSQWNAIHGLGRSLRLLLQLRGLRHRQSPISGSLRSIPYRPSGSCVCHFTFVESFGRNECHDCVRLHEPHVCCQMGSRSSVRKPVSATHLPTRASC